ncbi:MAG: hypothetical protein OQK71_01695, partial [Desulfobacter sp.]|nr:hypothetical protein [Desulfobacter sp.]
FPNLSHDIHIRFELGEPFENGSKKRLDQVNHRINKIFNATFNKEDDIYILIKDWEDDDVMFGNTTPNYLYEILRKEKLTKNKSS